MWFTRALGRCAELDPGRLKGGQSVGAKTLALIARPEFAQKTRNGAKEIAKKRGLKTVYEQNYPPTTVDPHDDPRDTRTKPDMVFVLVYERPVDIRARHEIGVALWSCSAAAWSFCSSRAVMEALGSMLNGTINSPATLPRRRWVSPA